MSAFDLTPRLVRESKSNGKDTILFDKALTGFGLRIHPSGRKVWIVQARIEGRSRRIVIARHGEMELAEARRRARDMLARIRAGENPADDIRRERETPTLRAFADEYLRRCQPHWKPSGRGTVRIYLKARILPAFGRPRLHDLRHTAASQAVMAGENLPLAGRLLGHRHHRTTAGNAHLADAHLVEAAEKVGRLIADAIRGGAGEPPVRPTEYT